MNDSTQKVLLDSLNVLNNIIYTSTNEDWKDNINFYLAVLGGIGTFIGIYAFYQQFRTKKTQDYLFKIAEAALERDDTNNKLKESKEKLNNIQTQLLNLQQQIKKDLPIEAKRAVLQDRLDESMESLNRYYKEVIDTKKKLSEINSSSQISDEILKAIENEIEPRYILRERVDSYKNILTITSSLAGISFIIFPNPIGNFIGILLLLVGIPILFLILKNSALGRSTNKEKLANNISLTLKWLGFIILTMCFLFSWTIYIIELVQFEHEPILLIISIIFSIIQIIYTYTLLKTSKKNVQINNN